MQNGLGLVQSATEHVPPVSAMMLGLTDRMYAVDGGVTRVRIYMARIPKLKRTWLMRVCNACIYTSHAFRKRYDRGKALSAQSPITIAAYRVSGMS